MWSLELIVRCCRSELKDNLLDETPHFTKSYALKLFNELKPHRPSILPLRYNQEITPVSRQSWWSSFSQKGQLPQGSFHKTSHLHPCGSEEVGELVEESWSGRRYSFLGGWGIAQVICAVSTFPHYGAKDPIVHHCSNVNYVGFDEAGWCQRVFTHTIVDKGSSDLEQQSLLDVVNQALKIWKT